MKMKTKLNSSLKSHKRLTELKKLNLIKFIYGGKIGKIKQNFTTAPATSKMKLASKVVKSD